MNQCRPNKGEIVISAADESFRNVTEALQKDMFFYPETKLHLKISERRLCLNGFIEGKSKSYRMLENLQIKKKTL